MKIIILTTLILNSVLGWSQKYPLKNLINGAKNLGYEFKNVPSNLINLEVGIQAKNSSASNRHSFKNFKFNKEQFPKNSNAITISLPTYELGTIEIELLEREGFNDNIIIETSSNLPKSSNKLSKHYRGIVKGYDESLVALSIFDSEIKGIISVKEVGNFNIYKEKENNYHTIIKESNIITNDTNPNIFSCGTTSDNISEKATNQSSLQNSTTSATDLENKIVKLYLEINYDTYEFFNFSITDTQNYITALYNEVISVYETEGVNLTISEIFIWTSEDVYEDYTEVNENFVGFGLDAFQDYRTSFNGDLAQLLTYNPPNVLRIYAGIAELGVESICEYRAHSHINLHADRSIENRSSTIQTIAHEIGHNLGSQHTHACAWNGNNTQIDDYGNYSYNLISKEYSTTPRNTEDGVDGGCLDASDLSYVPLLNVTPTIMSYYIAGQLIYEDGIGVPEFPLSNGFGEQPGNLIRNYVANSDCFKACEDFISISNEIYTSTEFYSAGTQITANGIIFAGDVTLQAGEQIILSDGFSVRSGGDFNAYIGDGCSTSLTSSKFLNENFSIQDQQNNILLQEKSINVKIYPNPTNGLFSIESTNIITSYSINNMIGKQVIPKEGVNTNTLNVDLSKFPSGIYFIEIQKENGKLVREKIIKN